MDEPRFRVGRYVDAYAVFEGRRRVTSILPLPAAKDVAAAMNREAGHPLMQAVPTKARLRVVTAEALPGRAAKEDHTKPKPDMRRDRPCITCGTVFPSEGAHNRMCVRCRCVAREDVTANPNTIGSLSGLSRRA